MYALGRPQLLDVALHHPLAPGLLREHGFHLDDPWWASARAEQAKLAQYRSTWPQPRPQVVPLVMSTTGRFSQSAVRLFREVVRAHARDRRAVNRQHLSEPEP